MGKPILCLDFDGVIHSYSSGWKGADVIPDPPVPGAFDFIRRAADVFEVVVFSSRSGQFGGIEAMSEWFRRWDDADERPGETDPISHFIAAFPKDKPPAFVTIDDRAMTFTGIFPDIESLRAFKPWNKGGV